MIDHKHFIVHKPYGYLSQFINNQTKRKKKMLGELYDFPEGTMAIGRLDVNSEGPDHAMSADPTTLSELVQGIRWGRDLRAERNGCARYRKRRTRL